MSILILGGWVFLYLHILSHPEPVHVNGWDIKQINQMNAIKFRGRESVEEETWLMHLSLK